MSEQAEREKLELRVRIAGSQVECPEHDDERSWKDGVCLYCSIDGETSPGKVYRFGGELRQPCECINDGPCSTCYRLRLDNDWATGNEHSPDCGEPECGGRGWAVPAEFMPLLLVELEAIGWEYAIRPHSVFIWMPKGKSFREEPDGNVEAALYRAVCVVLEAAP